MLSRNLDAPWHRRRRTSGCCVLVLSACRGCTVAPDRTGAGTTWSCWVRGGGRTCLGGASPIRPCGHRQTPGIHRFANAGHWHDV